MDGVPAEGTYLTPGQVARLFGVSPKTIYRWATEGRLPCAVTLGGHRRFRVEDIAAVAAAMGLEWDDAGDEGA